MNFETAYLAAGTAFYLIASFYTLKTFFNIREEPHIALRYLFIRGEGLKAVKLFLYSLVVYAAGMSIRIVLIFVPFRTLEYSGYVMGFAVPIITAVILVMAVRKFAQATAQLDKES